MMGGSGPTKEAGMDRHGTESYFVIGEGLLTDADGDGTAHVAAAATSTPTRDRCHSTVARRTAGTRSRERDVRSGDEIHD